MRAWRGQVYGAVIDQQLHEGNIGGATALLALGAEQREAVQGYAIKQPLVRWGESEAIWSKDVNLFYMTIERIDAIGWKRVTSPFDRDPLWRSGKFALSAHLSAL